MLVLKTRQLRILDFDTECRPLSWYGGDWVTKDVTSIGARFIGEDEAHCWLLGEADQQTMLEEFRALYDQADIVTGHYLRGFDLPLLNGALFEYGLPLLGPKLVQDTKLDLARMHGVSKSQENLGALLGLEHPKIPMSQADWRAANRLTPEGRERTRTRVLGDVDQHIELRQRLAEAGYLSPPKWWESKGFTLRTGYEA